MRQWYGWTHRSTYHRRRSPRPQLPVLEHVASANWASCRWAKAVSNVAVMGAWVTQPEERQARRLSISFSSNEGRVMSILFLANKFKDLYLQTKTALVWGAS